MAILPKHKEILLQQSELKTLSQWVEFFDSQYTKNQIYSFCYRNNKSIKKISKEEKSAIQSKNSRIYHINQDYFKTWSNNMAYMFGFWCADGCIYNGKIFDITTSMKDKYILKQFAKELDYQGNIFDAVDKQACRLNFSCVVIYNDIVSLGGSECKSMTLKFPEVPEEYLSDFIRGYFDGDGSVWDVKGKRVNCSFTCGSWDFLEKLWNILKEKANVQGGSYNKEYYSLVFGKNDSLKIRDFIYKNNPELFLKRKKDKFFKYN
jgi:hypothetical protein